MSESNFIVFCEDAPTFRIEGGLVYVEDRSGNLVFRKVMSIHNFHKAIMRAQKLLSEWESKQASPAIFRRRGDDDDQAA
jgi:hypothetical protein